MFIDSLGSGIRVEGTMVEIKKREREIAHLMEHIAWGARR